MTPREARRSEARSLNLDAGRSAARRTVAAAGRTRRRGKRREPHPGDGCQRRLIASGRRATLATAGNAGSGDHGVSMDRQPHPIAVTVCLAAAWVGGHTVTSGPGLLDVASRSWLRHPWAKGYETAPRTPSCNRRTPVRHRPRARRPDRRSGSLRPQDAPLRRSVLRSRRTTAGPDLVTDWCPIGRKTTFSRNRCRHVGSGRRSSKRSVRYNTMTYERTEHTWMKRTSVRTEAVPRRTWKILSQWSRRPVPPPTPVTRAQRSPLALRPPQMARENSRPVHDVGSGFRRQSFRRSPFG